MDTRHHSDRHDRDWPESDETDLGISYDLASPAAILRAQRALRARLGLDYLPTLCSPPSGRRVMARLWAGARRLAHLMGRGHDRAREAARQAADKAAAQAAEATRPDAAFGTS